MESMSSKLRSREYVKSEGKGWSMRRVWVVSGCESTTDGQSTPDLQLTAMLAQLNLETARQT